MNASNNINDLIVLSDETLCELVDIDLDELMYDKNYLLYMEANNILNTFKFNPKSPAAKAEFVLKSIYLKVALKYIDNESLELLANNYDEVLKENESIKALAKMFHKKQTETNKNKIKRH